MRLAQGLLGVLWVGRECDIEGSECHNTLRSTLSEVAGQALCVCGAAVVQKRESNHSWLSCAGADRQLIHGSSGAVEKQGRRMADTPNREELLYPYIPPLIAIIHPRHLL